MPINPEASTSVKAPTSSPTFQTANLASTAPYKYQPPYTYVPPPKMYTLVNSTAITGSYDTRTPYWYGPSTGLHMGELYRASFDLNSPINNPYYQPVQPKSNQSLVSPDVAQLQATRAGRSESARLLQGGSAQALYSGQLLGKMAALGSSAFAIPVSPDVWLEPGYGFNVPGRGFPAPAGGGRPAWAMSFGGGRGGMGRNPFIMGLVDWRIG